MNKYICIHGHFYQPPRENPWLDSVEVQDSAAPFHDWNERIDYESYSPNAKARILDNKEKVVDIVSNYAQISFNFGPTLLHWMQNHSPETYQAILHADVLSQKRFSGHGSALAQAYNHMILPLCHPRDKTTQVVWGLKDFEHRFKRKAEGMWLPETAVDIQSLDIMAQLDLKFVILAPNQAKRVRPLGHQDWTDVSQSQVNPKRPYLLNLPSGKSIAIFFYDGPISRSVAFEHLLENGERFARKLLKPFDPDSPDVQLVHIATDGETYGHHHKYGEMALAYALHTIEKKGSAQLTNYAEFLEKFPPAHEVEIIENTSWSCAHGIDRWMKDCGCQSGLHPTWHQKWREPLRNAFDTLRDACAPEFENILARYFKDPWGARNEYINVLLKPTPESKERFFAEFRHGDLSETDKVVVLKLLELQRNAMFMYTSCGWFFDEISGIETLQCLRYSARVVQLAKDVLNLDLKDNFLSLLEKAPSNVAELSNGKNIYNKFVAPAIVDLRSVVAHYAISSLFIDHGQDFTLYGFEIHADTYKMLEAGKAKWIMGRAAIKSCTTLDTNQYTFGVLYLGDHAVTAGIRTFQNDESYDETFETAAKLFRETDYPNLMKLLEKHFGGTTFTLKNLFLDDQRKVIDLILHGVFDRVERSFARLYEEHTPVMRFLAEMGHPLPPVYRSIAGYTRNADLRRALESDPPNLVVMESVCDEIKRYNLHMDSFRLPLKYQEAIERQLERLKKDPLNLRLIQPVLRLLEFAEASNIKTNLWKAQNILFEIKSDFSELPLDPVWRAQFSLLATKLSLKLL